MRNVIKNPIPKGNVTVRSSSRGTEKSVNQKTAQEAKRSKIKNKSSYLSIKQSTAIQSLAEKVEKGGNINLGEILIEAGYSKNTAKTPQKVFGKEIVQESLKKIGIDPAGIREAHEYLINSKEIIQYTSSNQFPAEEMIQLYQEHLGWTCITYIEDELKQTRTYEMIVRNDKNIIKSLELAYKYLPYNRDKNNSSDARDEMKISESLKKIRALTESKGFHVKNPIISVQG